VDEGRHDEITDADAGLTGAEEQVRLLSQLVSGDPKCGVDTCESHAGCPLDVIVEGAEALPVLLQQAERVPCGEVLELDDRLGEHLGHGVEELVDEIVVGVTTKPLARQPDVERIVEEFLVIRSHIQHDGQRVGRVDAGAGAVQRQLPDGNAHTVRT